MTFLFSLILINRKVSPSLVHLLNQSIDVLLPVTNITTLNKVLEFSAVEATIGV